MKIVAAAIRFDGCVYTGPHHATIISDMVRMGAVKHVGAGSEQGFLTSENRFVDRLEAKKIAVAAGQMKYPLEWFPPELYSEELWKVPSHWPTPPARPIAEPIYVTA